MPARETTIREALRDDLMKTGVFSDVWLTGLPEDYGRSAGDITAAAIDLPSGSARSLCDGDDETLVEESGQLTVTLLARDADAEVAAASALAMLQSLRDAVNGRSLAELTVGDHTYVSGYRARRAQSSERRIDATVRYQYLAEAWNREAGQRP